MLGATSIAFSSNCKPLQQARVGGTQSVLVGGLKLWEMVSATSLGFFLSESHFSWHIACTRGPDGELL